MEQPTIQLLNTSLIKPGDNDRRTFNQQALEELAASIRDNGLAQPITVRPIWLCPVCGRRVADQREPVTCLDCAGEEFERVYEIVAGERRFRAVTTVLEWAEIPAIVRDLSDQEASAIMLTENVHRVDLDPVDEANAYSKRMAQFGWSVAEVAQRANVSASRVRSRLALLNLVPELQQLVATGNMPIGFGVDIADLDPNRQRIAARWLRDQKTTPPRSALKELVNRLLEEQNQESLFDLDSLFVARVEAVVEEKGDRMKDILPRRTDLPAANTAADSIGALFDEYIAALLDKGHEAEALVVADLWAKAQDGNWARLSPFNSQVLRRHPEFVLGSEEE